MIRTKLVPREIQRLSLRKFLGALAARGVAVLSLFAVLVWSADQRQADAQGLQGVDVSAAAASEPTLAEALDRIDQLELIVSGLAGPSGIGVNDTDAGQHGWGVLSTSPVQSSTHFATYENGFTLRPYDADQTPFELKIELHNQFRYTNFESDGDPSLDAAGRERLISNRNDFDINRGRVVFTGYAFDQDLGYYVNIDYSTVASDSIQPLLAWVSFGLSDRLTMYLGLGKVPGTWEWQQTSRFTLGVDRSLATTFFRPSISAGIWANGSFTDQLHYTAFVGDGFNTLTLRADELDTKLLYSMLSWWEPLGDFGVGFSDLECHDALALRVGHGLTQTQSESSLDLTPGPEGTVVRLTDGTRLTELGALRPGERVNAFDIWLYTVHGGVKKRGFSLSGEYYFRWLRNLEGTRGTDFQSLFAHGFFVQSSAFVIPNSLELFVRGSQVTGEKGTGDEVSAGFNWYLWNQRNARATFEVANVDDSPAQQSRTGYVAGGSGTLFRAQLWTFF